MKNKFTAFGLTLILGSLTYLASTHASGEWINGEVPAARTKMLANLSPPDGQRGVVLASPSRDNPNYYFHWVRDAALTMDVVVEMWIDADGADREDLHQRLEDYVHFSRSNQLAHTLTGLGEPKFNVDGTPYMGPWGRPQNDGAALRAITLIHYANELGAAADDELKSVIKTDLDYVAQNWSAPSFDLWEETKGEHFFTRMVQRKALLLGAKWAEGESEAAASTYASEGAAIEAGLAQFWDGNRIQVTLNRVEGVDYKNSGLDTAVLIGALRGGMDDGIFDWNDERLLKTLDQLNQSFAGLYAQNQGKGEEALLGRYPEDAYNGGGFGGGNPWVLTTMAAAEVLYRHAASCGSDAAQSFQRAEAYTLHVAEHVPNDGELSEQIDRNTGYMISARDLTWSYASVLTAARARAYAIGHCVSVQSSGVGDL